MQLGPTSLDPQHDEEIKEIWLGLQRHISKVKFPGFKPDGKGECGSQSYADKEF